MIIETGYQFNIFCDNIRSIYHAKGILILYGRTVYSWGWPVNMDAAVNDNEAKR